MPRQISRIFINDLLSRTDIIDLISTRVKLKKQGKNYKACCPFHKEQNPSFTVNSEKQFYYCFGCGASGNAIDFLINYENLNFIESIEELATMHCLQLPSWDNCSPANKEYYSQRQKLFHLMNEISIFYQQELGKNTAMLAHKYLQKRGLSKAVIKKFAIGFAPPGWGNVLKRYGSSKSKLYRLNKVGMLITNDNGSTYDLFRERVMFPIRDKRGRVLAFGGRSLIEGQPKYIHSPDTEIFHKSDYLYGMYEVQQQHAKLTRILVVEGYIDVVSLSQFGIDYAVALLGTTTTAEHIQRIYRITDQVVYCYDGDPAGMEAAWRSLQKALPYLADGCQLRFMFIPKGEDPDTLVRKIGKQAFEQQIESAQPLSAFLFDKLMLQVDLTSQDGRAKLSTLALPLINKVPGQTLRIYLRQELGNKLGIFEDSQLEKILPKITTTKLNNFRKLRFKRTTMRIIIGLLVQNPRFAFLVPTVEVLNQAHKPGVQLLIELVHACKVQPGLTTGGLLENYRYNKFYKQLETLATWNHMIMDDMIEDTFLDALASLYDSVLQQRQNWLIARDRSHRLNSDERQELWSLNIALAKK